jgi:hypothetical protein
MCACKKLKLIISIGTAEKTFNFLMYPSNGRENVGVSPAEYGSVLPSCHSDCRGYSGVALAL